MKRNSYRGVTRGATNRKQKYLEHPHQCVSGREVRKLSAAEIEEFHRHVQRAMVGDFPRAKPL